MMYYNKSNVHVMYQVLITSTDVCVNVCSHPPVSVLLQTQQLMYCEVVGSDVGDVTEMCQQLMYVVIVISDMLSCLTSAVCCHV